MLEDDRRPAGRGRLARSGIAVAFDSSPHHMHHKFAIFDLTRLLTGSYNWTRSAAESNEEEFDILWGRYAQV